MEGILTARDCNCAGSRICHERERVHGMHARSRTLEPGDLDFGGCRAMCGERAKEEGWLEKWWDASSADLEAVSDQSGSRLSLSRSSCAFAGANHLIYASNFLVLLVTMVADVLCVKYGVTSSSLSYCLHSCYGFFCVQKVL